MESGRWARQTTYPIISELLSMRIALLRVTMANYDTPDTLRPDMGRARRRCGARQYLSALCRPAHRARSGQSASVRRAAARRPAREGTGKNTIGRRPQRPDIEPRRTQPGSRERGADRLFRGKRQALRVGVLQRVGQATGHLSRRRTGARLHASGHHDRLRRQSYFHPRRFRRARLWHWHLRGRACARDADSHPDEVEEHARGRRRQAAAECHRQGHDTHHYWRNRRRRRDGYVLEFAGEAIRALSMEGRMTVCNMSVEAGARTSIIAPDEKTYEFLKDRPKSPKGKAWEEALRYWETLRSDEAAQFDREVRLNAGDLPPLVTWGTNPEQVSSITGRVPRSSEIADESKRRAAERALEYMGLRGGEKIVDIALDRVFIGSCTNARIEDLREAARVVKGKQVNPNVSAMIVPGSGLVKAQAEAEGLDRIFVAAGFDWREPGCSMCLAMNPDKLKPGERCASTSNRNYEGRQGYKGRTHLVSPAMAAAAAIAGRFVDMRTWG